MKKNVFASCMIIITMIATQLHAADLYVPNGGTPSYTTIDAAVVAAGDDDVIHLTQSQTYPGTTITDKHLTLIADVSDVKIEDVILAGLAKVQITNATLIGTAAPKIGLRLDGSSTATLNRCLVLNNEYGITLNGTNSVTVQDNCQITSNTIYAVHVAGPGCNLVIRDSNVQNNNYGLVIKAPSSVTLLERVSLSDQYHSGTWYEFDGASPDSSLTIRDSQITGNGRGTAVGDLVGGSGLGLYRTVDLDVSNTLIADNVGAGIYRDYNNNTTISRVNRVTIKNNKTDGIVFWNCGPSSQIEVDNCWFENSETTMYGQIVDITPQATFRNCVMVNGGERTVYANQGQTILENCTIFSSGHTEVGFFNDGGDQHQMLNCILDGVRVGTGGVAPITVSHCLVNATESAFAVEPSTSEANIYGEDPQFTNAATLDFHLLDGSPALGAGQDLGITSDYDGNMRANPSGTAPDLGAYESYLVPVEISSFSVE